MGLLLKMGGTKKEDTLHATDVELLSCVFTKELPEKSVAPSAEESYALTLEGKIAKNTEGKEPTLTTLAEWSTMPSSSTLALRNIQVIENNGDYTNRVYSMPMAFVFSYSETFEESQGEGRFKMVMKMKKVGTGFFEASGGFAQTQSDAGFLVKESTAF